MKNILNNLLKLPFKYLQMLSILIIRIYITHLSELIMNNCNYLLQFMIKNIKNQII